MAARGEDLLKSDAIGLACKAGGFHIDPWGRAETAVITHAHGDHARGGSGRYLCARSCEPMLRARLPQGAAIESVPFGERFELAGKSGSRAVVSFHPAGHIRGSAQVRVEHEGRVWVAAGDYKRASDPTAEAFEVVKCDAFITESTFALPIYRWKPSDVVAREMLDWWRDNAESGKVSALFTYALGKAQRVMAEIARLPEFPAFFEGKRIYTHGSVEPLTQLYREAGVSLPPTTMVRETEKGHGFAGSLVIAPPSAAGSPWMRRFGAPAKVDTGFASGWMLVRGVRRRRGYDRGFVLSDHADWDDLLRTIRETSCTRLLCTHGFSETLAKYASSLGIDAGVLETHYAEEDDG